MPLTLVTEKDLLMAELGVVIASAGQDDFFDEIAELLHSAGFGLGSTPDEMYQHLVTGGYDEYFVAQLQIPGLWGAFVKSLDERCPVHLTAISSHGCDDCLDD